MYPARHVHPAAPGTCLHLVQLVLNHSAQGPSLRTPSGDDYFPPSQNLKQGRRDVQTTQYSKVRYRSHMNAAQCNLENTDSIEIRQPAVCFSLPPQTGQERNGRTSRQRPCQTDRRNTNQSSKKIQPSKKPNQKQQSLCSWVSCDHPKLSPVRSEVLCR